MAAVRRDARRFLRTAWGRLRAFARRPREMRGAGVGVEPENIWSDAPT